MNYLSIMVSYSHHYRGWCLHQFDACTELALAPYWYMLAKLEVSKPEVGKCVTNR